MAEKVSIWSKELKIPREAQENGISIAQRFLEKSPQRKKDEEKIYAASLFIGCMLTNHQIKQYKIADAAGYSDITLRKYRREIANTLQIELK